MVDSPLLAHLIGALFCVQYEANIFYGMGFVKHTGQSNFFGFIYNTITYYQIGFGSQPKKRLDLEGPWLSN